LMLTGPAGALGFFRFLRGGGAAVPFLTHDGPEASHCMPTAEYMYRPPPRPQDAVALAMPGASPTWYGTPQEPTTWPLTISTIPGTSCTACAYLAATQQNFARCITSRNTRGTSVHITSIIM
jgi:hypothetical protein